MLVNPKAPKLTDAKVYVVENEVTAKRSVHVVPFGDVSTENFGVPEEVELLL